jgi:hypothetical protein
MDAADWVAIVAMGVFPVLILVNWWLGSEPDLSNRRCEPNVIAGYEGYTEVLQWSCGDVICRCGGTKIRGYLDR